MEMVEVATIFFVSTFSFENEKFLFYRISLRESIGLENEKKNSCHHLGNASLRKVYPSNFFKPSSRPFFHAVSLMFPSQDREKFLARVEREREREN